MHIRVNQQNPIFPYQKKSEKIPKLIKTISEFEYIAAQTGISQEIFGNLCLESME
jgi:hypothetical protein